MMMRWLLALVLLGVEGRWKNSGWKFTSLSLNPAHEAPCLPTEITVTFAFGDGVAVTAGDSLTVNLGGFTSGSCENRAGDDLASDRLLYSPAAVWEVTYTEGTVREGFADSVLTLTALVDIDPMFDHVVVLDPENGIKPNCGMAANSPLITISGSVANDTSVLSREMFNATDAVNGTCYMTETALIFKPPRPKVASEVEMYFNPALKLREGDTVIVRLAGWTSGAAQGVRGADIYNVLLRDEETALGNESVRFRGRWFEGSAYVQHEAGFEDSELHLTVRDGITLTPGKRVGVVVKKANLLRPQCGMAGPYELTTFSVNETNGTGIRAFTPEAQDAVGDGCAALDFCAGNGECDHCLERCDCAEGYASPSTYLGCASLECPKGRTWAQRPMPSGLAHASFTECSDAGKCNARTGTCACFDGYEGGACDRRKCPGFIPLLGDCSGHGTCLSVRALSVQADARPLSTTTSGDDLPYLYGAALAEESSDVWDADRIFGCICDSSWPVGLGPGEYQEAEWFGADCSLKHCPSGDDPMTLADDTNCTNATAPGGRGVGQRGNLCHVECSNRGVCDYRTGTCSCFRGFDGHNCDIIDVNALQEDAP